MKQKRDLKSPDRRDFFKMTGAGLGVAGAVAIGLSGGAAKAESKPDRGFKKGSYRETEHVRQAYKAARF